MPDVGDMVNARIVGTLFGQPIINQLGFVSNLPYGTFSELGLQLVTELDAALGVLSAGDSLWTDQLVDAYRVVSVDVQDVFPAVAAQYSTASAAVGQQTGEGMPPNDCLCITWRSDFKGTSGRGRSYLSGQIEANQESGFWSGNAQDAASGIGSAMLASFGEAGTGSFRFSVLHRVSGGAPLVPPEVKPVMSFTIHNEVRSLGRRAMGRRIRRHIAA